MKVFCVLLALIAVSRACTNFDIYRSNNENTARGPAFPFARSRAEFRVKSTTRLSGKFGFYLRNETQNDVAGVTIHHTELFTFFSFYGSQGSNVYSDYLNGTFFVNGNWKDILIEYHKDELRLSFMGNNPKQDDVDFFRRDDKPVAHSDDLRNITFKARISGYFDMPLVIYPMVLEGMTYRVSHGCLDNQEFEKPSTYFENRGPVLSGHGSVFFVPNEEFQMGTLIFKSSDDSKSTEQVTLTKEDVAVGLYNEIELDYKFRDLAVSLQKGRKCLQKDAITIEGVESVAFLANAPVKWLFKPRKSIPNDHRIPRCEALESATCQSSVIGDDRSSLWTSSFPLGEQLELLVKPLGGPGDTSFSLWVQEQQEILAGVRLRETDEGFEVDFFQVVNGTSYHLRSPETLPDFEIEEGEWVHMFLRYDDEGLLEVGMRNHPEEDWQSVSGAVRIEYQLPLKAFVWSRNDLEVAYHCTEEAAAADNLPRERPTLTSAPFVSYNVYYTSLDLFFLPGPNFKFASVFVHHYLTGFDVVTVHSSDVVIGKWNRITLTDTNKLGHLPRIELPKKSGCRIRQVVARTSTINSVTLYTNTPTNWTLRIPPHPSEMAPEMTNTYCALDGDSACSTQPLGRPSFRSLRYKDDMVIRLRINDRPYPPGVKIILFKDSISAEIDVFSYSNKKIVIFSENLGINTTFPKWKSSGKQDLTISLRILETQYVDIAIERREQLGLEWHSARSTKKIFDHYPGHWVFLYPKDANTDLEIEGEETEEYHYEVMRNLTRDYVLDDNELYVSFKSRVGHEALTSFMATIHNQKLGYIGTLEFFYGSNQNTLVFDFDVHYFATTFHPTEWTEMKLKQLGGGFLSASLRSSSSGGEWETKIFRIYFERNAPLAPLFVQFESLHAHDIVVNCHHKDGRQAMETNTREVVDKDYLRPQSRQIVWVDKATTVEVPADGQACPFLVTATQKLYSGLMYFHHHNGNVSTEDLHFDMDIGDFNLIYFSNAEDEESHAKISVPVADDEVFDKEVTSKGRVERITIYTADPSMWITPSCPCAGVNLAKHLPMRCENFTNMQDGDPSFDELDVPLEDFALVLQTTWARTNLQVYFFHASGLVSIHVLETKNLYVNFGGLDVKNARNEFEFAAVMTFSHKKPVYKKLKFPGPVKSVQVVSMDGPVCANVVESFCK